MDVNINSVRSECQWIINELENVACDVDSFSGIGAENCAHFIRITADTYRDVLRKLDNIDKTSVTEEWKARNENN